MRFCSPFTLMTDSEFADFVEGSSMDNEELFSMEPAA